MPWHQAYLQTLFSQSQQIRYFAVVLADAIPRAGPPHYIYPSANRRPSALQRSRSTTPTARTIVLPPTSWDQLLKDFHRHQEDDEDSHQVGEPQHVSEITPWMRTTGIYIHLNGVELNQLHASYKIPYHDKEPRLAAICESIARILENAMGVLLHDRNTETRRLSRVNARLLNTFTRKETSQDPIAALQNEQTRRRYSETWQKLICYWERVVEQDHLLDTLFQPSDHQLSAWVEVTEAADGLLDSSFDASDPRQRQAQQDALDGATLRFSMSIIQHALPRRAFDSVLVSFAAVLFWSPQSRRWLTLAQYTTYLSQLIYDCQMMVLAHCLTQRPEEDLGTTLVQIRDQWLLNDTAGPVAELLENRLLGFHIGRTEVPPAQVRWYRDGQTVIYQDVTLHLTDLHTIIWRGLQEAQTIFVNELCLSGRPAPAADIPTVDLSRLLDNWDASARGHSFLTDPRNHSQIQPLRDWLFRRVGQTPSLATTFWTWGANSKITMRVDAADQYEQAVQRFLRALFVPFFLGAGQQARRMEFVGLRWQNTSLETRNLYLHDGQMLFILQYHKSINMSNASRWPVRFLLPEVAQLVAQFLILVQPFRRSLQRHTAIPEAVSDYLWSRGREPWHPDRVTETVIETSQRLLGKKIHVRAWRQLAVGIAIKKFPSAAASLWASESDRQGLEDTEEGEPGGSMAAVFHWQASHTPRTGNQIYGGSVNFRGALTDAGLQEFRRASDMWHRLLRDPLGFSATDPSSPSPRAKPFQTIQPSARFQPVSTRWEEGPTTPSPSSAIMPVKRRRRDSDDSPLVRRVARRRAPRRGRLRWTTDEASQVLQRMYGAQAQYRSPEQERALQYIVAGAGQVVAILGSGEGKSLLYFLPCQLPGAGTTVVILPLIVLKEEMQQRSQQHGIRARVWDETCDVDEFISCPLILVGVEQAVQRNFRSVLLRLHVANQLDRIVFDECHLAVTAADYRASMALLPTLREYQCQSVFLSGSLPPDLVPELEEHMHLQGARMIRGMTTRRDLRYEVRRCQPDQAFMSEFALPWIECAVAALDPSARAIVYCPSRDLAEDAAAALGVPFYHAHSGSVEEKAAVLAQWHAGEPRCLAATSAFGMGIDHPAVRLVIHLGPPRRMIDFAQEVGRLGRDGSGGKSVVLLPGQWKGPGAALTGSDEEAMYLFLDQPRCRVAEIAKFLDGDSRACLDDKLRCDQCQIERLRPSVQPGPSPRGQDASGEDDLGDLQVGSWLHALQVREESELLAEYQEAIHELHGTCILCQVLPWTGQSSTDHGLQLCRNPRRTQFFEARRTAVQAGQGRGGWMQAYAGCYYCYHPQRICGGLGRDHCVYPDLVMPACWAIYQHEVWREADLPGLAGGAVLSDEREYMQWLGEKRRIFGIKGSNATIVAGAVFQWLTGRQGKARLDRWKST